MRDDNKAELEKEHLAKSIGHVALELSATVFIIAAVVVGVLVWRLSTGPIDIAFAKDTIKDALRDPATGMNIDFDKAVLQWPDLQGPLLLRLNGGKVYDGDGNLIVAIDSAALSLNKTKLLLAKVSPEGLILRKPSVLLKRSADNQFSIGLTSGVDAGASSGSAASASVDDVLDVFRVGQGRSSGQLAALRLVRIEDARVLIDDRVLSRSWQVPRVDVSLERERDGMRSKFDIDLPRLVKTPEEIVPNVEGDIFARWDTGEIFVETVLTQFHTRFLSDKIPELTVLEEHNVRLDATARAVLGRDFSLAEAEAVVFSKGGSLNIPEFDDAPLAFKDFGFKATYNGADNLAQLDALKVTVGGVAFNAEADLVHAETGIDSGYAAKGRLGIAEVEHSQIVSLWPKALDEDKSKEWIIDKILKGDFRDVYADFEIIGEPDGGSGLSIDLNRLQAGFDFKNLDVKYKETMAPAKKGIGKGVFDYKSATIRIDLSSAEILDMDVSEAALVFTNIIEKDAGRADLAIQVNGPFQSMLRYLSDEPIGLQMDGDINEVRGNIASRVGLKFPTKDDVLKEEVVIDIDGSVDEMYLPKVVQDLPLSDGPFKISVKDGVFSLLGNGKLDGRDINLDYREFLFPDGKHYSSETKVKMVADDELRGKLGIDLTDFMSGAAAIDVVYTKRNDESAIADVRADITNSAFFLNPFDYEKPVGVAGEVTLKAHLFNDDLKRISALKVDAPDVTMAPATLAFKMFNGETELLAGEFPDFTLGETKGEINFEISDSGVLTLFLDGPFLDMRPFLDQDKKDDDTDKDNPPMRISVSADKLRTSDDMVISNGQIFADINSAGRFNQLEFDAIAGSGAVYLRFKPDVSGNRIFRVEADDAGAVLKAFGVYPNVRGGSLVIHGEPVRGAADRNLIGKARMSDFKVVDAPALARLISALSLPGATEMLAGEGLTFSKLESDFDWVSRSDGSVLVVKNGRTSGNSLGLTFEGTYGDAQKKLDIGGTIIPLSGINNILKDIPLVGNILGGSSGLFAATYSMKGQGKEVDVVVNPLSVLAPGILRSILFEGGPPSAGEPSKAAPKKAPHVAE